MTENLVCYCPSCTAPIHPVPEDTNPGDWYVCYNPSCRTASVLTDALTLRLATAEEISARPIDEQLMFLEMQRIKRGMPLDAHC